MTLIRCLAATLMMVAAPGWIPPGDRAWLEANPESLFDMALAGQTLWATQVWMSVNAAIIACVGWWWLTRGRRDGFVAAWIAAFAWLPTPAVALALAGWVAYITPKVRWLGRQFQDVSGSVA